MRKTNVYYQKEGISKLTQGLRRDYRLYGPSTQTAPEQFKVLENCVSGDRLGEGGKAL